jgi:UDP-2-acetamido-2,6-beta-L-arabino-hexul-4-ose reductase
MSKRRCILVTGANGFIGRNLCLRLAERGDVDILRITRESSEVSLVEGLMRADIVFHLAGVNRPKDEADFVRENVGFTARLCNLAAKAACPPRIVYASSIQAVLNNAYGRSKREVEALVEAYGEMTGVAVDILRLPNVFGKWARPNYNSVVATICHNAAHGLPAPTGDLSAPLRLVYIDDVTFMLSGLVESESARGAIDVLPVYNTTLGQLIDIVQGFVESRQRLTAPHAGSGLTRAIYATYLSYLPSDNFVYSIPVYRDARGEFVEMLKTKGCGQFSYFSAWPGVTRGEHYHHSKAEKFLVIRGTASFAFRNIDTGENFEIVSRGGDALVVESVPGWVHDVTNVGDDELICMLWASEIFDSSCPDTHPSKVRI